MENKYLGAFALISLSIVLIFFLRERREDIEQIEVAMSYLPEDVFETPKKAEPTRSVADTNTKNKENKKIDLSCFFKSKDKIYQDYVLSSELNAVLDTDYKEVFGEKIVSYFGHTIFKSANFKRDRFHPIVKNTINSKVGIVTGRIELVLNDGELIEDFINKYDMSITYRLDHINSYYVKFNSYKNVFEEIHSIRDDMAVLEANLEIIEDAVMPL